MKKLTILFVFIGLSLCSKSQVHWLINQDSVPNCKMIQLGKFVNQVTDSENRTGYYAVFENGFETEFVDNGKYYVKSKLDFKTPCEYTVTVVEVTIPNYAVKIGSTYNIEIVTTATIDKLIELKVKGDNDWQYFVLEKVE